MIKHVTQIRVRYADTDQMKIVYHGKYLEYFEVGRAALIRSLGLPYSELETRGILLPVIEAFAKYRKPARYDDLLSIEAVVRSYLQRHSKLTIEYSEITRKHRLRKGTLFMVFKCRHRETNTTAALFRGCIEKGVDSVSKLRRTRLMLIPEYLLTVRTHFNYFPFHLSHAR